MKNNISKAVTMPPSLFLAPIAPAAANLGIHIPMAIFVQTFSNINPLFFVLSALLIHILIVAMGKMEFAFGFLYGTATI